MKNSTVPFAALLLSLQLSAPVVADELTDAIVTAELGRTFDAEVFDKAKLSGTAEHRRFAAG